MEYPQDIERGIRLLSLTIGIPTDAQWKDLALACIDQAGVAYVLQEEIAEQLGVEPLGVVGPRLRGS